MWKSLSDATISKESLWNGINTGRWRPSSQCDILHQCLPKSFVLSGSSLLGKISFGCTHVHLGSLYQSAPTILPTGEYNVRTRHEHVPTVSKFLSLPILQEWAQHAVFSMPQRQAGSSASAGLAPLLQHGALPGVEFCLRRGHLPTHL